LPTSTYYDYIITQNHAIVKEKSKHTKEINKMGIFSKKKPKVQDNLSTSRSIYWGGGSAAGVHVNEESAMRTAAVYACVRVISETIASLPVNIYRYEDDGTKRTPNHHLHNLLHNAPNPEMTNFSFRETLMTHLLLYGNAYAQIIRDTAGRVVSVISVDAG
jgi:phage portal protein BeeE